MHILGLLSENRVFLSIFYPYDIRSLCLFWAPQDSERHLLLGSKAEATLK